MSDTIDTGGPAFPAILINEDNHENLSRYANPEQDPCFWNTNYKACLRAHESVNDYIIAQTDDCGGGYLNWLEAKGIKSGTENGWWSIDAIKPANLNAFIAARNANPEGGV